MISPSSTTTNGLTDAQLRASDVPVADATAQATLATLAREGTGITGASMPSGGSYTLGWLSAIWKALTDRLPSALVSGRLDVNVGNTPTVSAPVGSPVFVRLSDGSSAIATLPVSFSGDVTTIGKAAHDAPVAGNPVLIAGKYNLSAAAVSADGDTCHIRVGSTGEVVVTGTVNTIPAGAHTVQGGSVQDTAIGTNPVLMGGNASTATPSAMSADGDAVFAWFDRNGRLHVNQNQYDHGNSVWIPKRTHYRGTAFSSSSRPAGNYDSSVLDSYGHRFLIIYATLEVPASGTLTVAVNDSTGAYRLATAGTAISTTTPVAYAMGDGLIVPATGLTYYGQVWCVPVPGQFKIRGTTTTTSTWKIEYELVG